MKSRKYHLNTILLMLFVVSFLHLIRDILQIADVHIWLTQSLGTNTAYCRPFCDYITLPFEIYVIFAVFFTLPQKKPGVTGFSAFVVFGIWMGIFTLSYLYR